MLETTAARLSERGGPHFGSPDKTPAVRLATLEAAGRAGVPFTTGLLIGIGETRAERIEALLAIRDLHERHGHIQEVIIQNFRAKPGTRMANAAEPTLDDHLWTIAIARIVLGPAMNIQAPPNLQPEGLAHLIRAGINDWGGVSPVTPDHVNPEAPWPHLRDLELATERAGRTLVERLAIYPGYLAEPKKWLEPVVTKHVLRLQDTQGFAREDSWSPGAAEPLPVPQVSRMRSGEVPSAAIARTLDRVAGGGKPIRGRDRQPLRGPRKRFRRRVPRGRQAAGGARRRCGDLCGQPQHQLHQHLHLRLQVLRLLERAAQLRVAREALQSEFR